MLTIVLKPIAKDRVSREYKSMRTRHYIFMGFSKFYYVKASSNTKFELFRFQFKFIEPGFFRFQFTQKQRDKLGNTDVISTLLFL